MCLDIGGGGCTNGAGNSPFHGYAGRLQYVRICDVRHRQPTKPPRGLLRGLLLCPYGGRGCCCPGAAARLLPGGCYGNEMKQNGAGLLPVNGERANIPPVFPERSEIPYNNHK